MKINLAWLADFVDLQVDEQELLERINTQLGEIEAIEDMALKYKGALIVRVVSIKPHPKADKLQICLIDDAQTVQGLKRQEGYVQVVCGADNVRGGMLAVWLPPAAILPASFNSPKPLLLQEREIRGELSAGMLASAMELDIGLQEEEILEIKQDLAPMPLAIYPVRSGMDDWVGKPFAQQFDLETKVVDIENKMFTHRPDCFGLLGVAREIAAICGSPFKSPQWYQVASDQGIQKNELLELKIECPQLVARFRALIIRDLKVGESDLLLQSRLASCGFKSINNIVDATNYMMYLSGQPSHAFDYDKLLALSSKKTAPLALIVRQSREGEKLHLINDKVLTFKEPAVVIAGDRELFALGGIMGGISSEIGMETKNVLLECANFDMYDLRRTSMHYGITSEALTRFTKGQSRRQLATVAKQTAVLIAQVGSGELFEPSFEFSDSKVVERDSCLETSLDFINARLGTQLEVDVIVKLLQAAEFEVTLKASQLSVKAPFWRTDIAIAEDIVEEVGRLNGYMRIKPMLPQRPVKSPDGGADGQLLAFKDRIRRLLAAQGANEVIAHSFVATDFVKQAYQDPDNSFHLINPLNPRLEVYRQSLTPSLAALAEVNRRAGWRQFALFEIGSAHQRSWALDEDGLPLDLQRVAFIYRSSPEPEAGNPFYVARRYLDLIAQSLDLSFEYRLCERTPSLEDKALSLPYDLGRSALIVSDDIQLGIIGLLKLPGGLAAWEISTDALLKLARSRELDGAYQSLAKYPANSQDLTLKVSLELTYAELYQSLEEVLVAWRLKLWRLDLKLLSIFQPPGEQQFKNVSFRLTAGHQQRSVRKQEVTEILNDLIKTAAKRHNAAAVV